jgi:hypothetical protein
MRHDLPLPSFPSVIVDLAVDGPRCATRRDRHDEQNRHGDIDFVSESGPSERSTSVRNMKKHTKAHA